MRILVGDRVVMLPGRYFHGDLMPAFAKRIDSGGPDSIVAS